MADEPLAITFDDLYVRRGTLDMTFHPDLKALDGRPVVLSGVLAPDHDHHDEDDGPAARRHGAARQLVLTDEAGQCPDCALVPTATVLVSGIDTLPEHCVPGRTEMTVRGMIEFGYAVDPFGQASFIRVVGANLVRWDHGGSNPGR